MADSIVPPYVIALCIVLSVVGLGLLISILYYLRMRKNEGRHILESQDTEQLRDADSREQAHQIQLPDIHVCSEPVINPQPSPSIFSRGDFFMEVLDGVEKARNALNNSTEREKDGNDSSFATSEESSLHTEPNTAISCSKGGLRVREHSQADASTAALRGSISCSSNIEEGYVNIDIAANSMEIIIYEDPIGSNVSAQINNLENSDTSIVNENFRDNERDENLAQNTKQNCSSESEVGPSPYSKHGDNNSSTYEETNSINNNIKIGQNEIIPTSSLSNPSTPTFNLPLYTEIEFSECEISHRRCSQPVLGTISPGGLENIAIVLDNESYTFGEEMSTVSVVDKNEAVVVNGIEALCTAGDLVNEDTAYQLPKPIQIEVNDENDTLNVKENSETKENASLIVHDENYRKDYSEENIEVDEVISNSEPKIVVDIETSSPPNKCIMMTSNWSTSSPSLIDPVSSMTDAEEALSMSYLSLNRFEAKLPSTPLSHTSEYPPTPTLEYTPVYNSREMGTGTLKSCDRLSRQ